MAKVPMFVCHANCCRSLLAYHLYRRLCPGLPALMAGMEAGTEAAPRALKMLKAWGIEVRDHKATQISRELCDRADAIFIAAPSYAHRLILEYGMDLARKTYLYADPFTRPTGFRRGEYRVIDPSFDRKHSTGELVREFAWMRERSLAIRLALMGEGPPLAPVSEYLSLCQSVDPRSH
jgi:protein-tyrosine-phosphatase